jgi:hypothetical protein
MKDQAVVVDEAVLEEAEAVRFCSDVMICWVEERFVRRAKKDAIKVINLLMSGCIATEEVSALVDGFRCVAHLGTVLGVLRKEAARIVAAVTAWLHLKPLAPGVLAPAH